MEQNKPDSIQILSDLHLEAPKSYDTFQLTSVSPYLALIGDIGCTKDAGYLTFIAKQLCNFKIVFLLLGNHEPYHSSWKTAKAKLRQLELEMTEKNNSTCSIGSLVFMDQRRYDLSPSITILGCTLFSKVSAEQMEHVSFGLNDFYHIEGWTVEQHNEAHISDLSWLNAEVRSIAEREPNRRIIILTHYSPTISPSATDPAHKHSKISSGFSTDLAAETCWTSESVVAWVFGHTHFNCDYRDPGTGKRVLTNQRGYYFSQAAGFEETKCIEL